MKPLRVILHILRYHIHSIHYRDSAVEKHFKPFVGRSLVLIDFSDKFQLEPEVDTGAIVSETVVSSKSPLFF